MVKVSNTNAIPIMTSNNAPFGLATASIVQNNDARYQPYRAFNRVLDDANNAWVTNNVTNQWIAYEFSSPIVIRRYALAPNVLNNKSEPRNFRFEGYNGSEWKVLDTQTNITNWTSNTYLYFDFQNTTAYYNYRVYVVNNNGYTGYISISDIQMFKSIPSTVLKNSENQKYYSLSNNTLIHLPNSSTENMILHGIEQGKEIPLDVPFTKHNYVNENPVDNVSSKVFTQDVDKINTLSIKEFKKSKSTEPIYTWHEAKMTANDAPAPLVASASTVYSNYFPFKAFNGTNVDSNDCWVSDSKTDGWLQIDFGDRKKFNTISITSRKHTDNSPIENSPKDFNIEASNNGIDFTVLSSLRNINDWGPDTKKTFSFTNENSYRFFRINVLSNNGGISVIIALISFGYKREVI